MTAVAAWQVIMPLMVSNAIENKAYLDYYGEYEPEDFEMDGELD